MEIEMGFWNDLEAENFDGVGRVGVWNENEKWSQCVEGPAYWGLENRTSVLSFKYPLLNTLSR